MKRIMIPSALATILLALAGPSTAQWPLGRDGVQGALKAEPSPTITVRGRFQFFTSPNVKGETFMLDTETGRVWILKKDGATGLFTLERIRVEDVDAAPKDGSKASKTGAEKASQERSR